MAEPPTPPLRRNGDITPVPDPTQMTLLLIEREIGSLREILEQRINGDKAVLETRLDGMDEAIRIARESLEKFPEKMDEKVMHLAEVANVKFDAIQVQFTERDVRTEQTARDAKTAVDAALQAQKEQAGKSAETFDRANQKSEEQFTKQIDAQGALIATATRALEDKINDLKDRFNRGEGRGEGQVVAKQQSQASGNYTLAVMGFIGGTLIGVVGIVLAVARP